MSDLDFNEIPDPLRRAPTLPKAPVEAPAERSPTRAERRMRMALACLLSLAWVGLLTLRFGLRDDLFAGAVGGKLLGMFVLGALALGVALRSGERGRPAGIRVVQGLLVGVPLVYGCVVLATSLPTVDGEPAWHGALPCFIATLTLSFGPLLFSSLVLARSFSTIPAWRGAAIGAIAGLLGSIGIDAHCATDGCAHVFLAHGLPILALALLGAAFGARFGKLG